MIFLEISQQIEEGEPNMKDYIMPLGPGDFRKMVGKLISDIQHKSSATKLFLLGTSGLANVGYVPKLARGRFVGLWPHTYGL